jgi:type IV pilus assembly protein PilN
MIRINLLPEKRKKKPLRIYTYLIRGAVILVLTILVLGIFTFRLTGKIADLKEEKVIKEKKLSELKVLLKEVENYERDNQSYREKSEIIKRLKNNQHLPLRLLDEVSIHLPKGVWLSSLGDSGGTVGLTGFAFTNVDLVSYVQNLKSSAYFQDVQLIESRQAEFGGVSLYTFSLSFRMKG